MMKIIYTVTFNPALDYVVSVDHFETGKVNRVKEEHIFIGGKGINVSVILKRLGYSTKALGFVGGFTGEKIVQGTEEDYGIETDFITVKEGMSRINVKLRSDQETEINGKGPVITEADLYQLFAKLDKMGKSDVLVLSGSIPACVPNDIYEIILKKVADKNVYAVVDATGYLLLNVLKYKPFLIKPNNHEIEDIFNVILENEEDIIYYAKKLQKMGALNVLDSLSGDGSFLVDQHGEIHRMGVCQGKVKNSVGAGDSMVAGFIGGYLRNGDYEEALKLATACGGATAFSDGLATKEFIYENLRNLERGENG